MGRLIKIILAALLIFTILSCEVFDNSAGSFHIRFQWPEDGKPDFTEKEYHLWVVLEQWKDGDDEKASILMQTAPAKFDEEGKAEVDLSDVQYGEDLVIKVEIRGSTKTQDRVLYFGRSELFTFKSSDKGKEVKVKLQTQATPGTGAQDENGFSLKIVQNGKEVTKINDTVVSVRIKVVNGTKVIIANSLSILEQYLNDNSSVTDGIVEKPVTELVDIGEGQYDLESWDLNTGLEFSDTDGGERIVYGKLVNDEGYVSETVQATVAVDKTAPVVINPTVSPNPAKLDDVVTATFSFSEDIDPESLELDWGGLSFTVDESSEGSIIKYTYTVSSEDEEKIYALKGSAKDVIGNGPVEFSIGDLVIDRTKPSVVDEEVSVTDDKSSIKSGDFVTVKFKISEEIEGDPEVTVDGKKFTRVGEETEPYEFSYTLSDTDIDGTKTILVSLTDKARNSVVAELEKKVDFDLSSPEIVNPTVTPSGNPGLAALGTRIEVRFNISEEVEELKFYVNGTENTDTFTETVDGLTYVYSRTVDATDSDESAYEFSVSAIDSAGNSLSQQTLGTVNIDVVKPEILTHIISKTNVKLLESFDVTLNVSEALSSLSLLVGSKDISSGCTLSTTVDKQYVCTHIANTDDDEGDGVKQFSVMMTDLAGNSATVQLKDGSSANETIEYDVTPPDIVNPVVAPEKANLGSTIDVRFSFTENVENLVVDWGGLDGKFERDNEETNKKLFIYKHKVAEEDEEGIFPVTVTSAFDEAGNEISAAILIGNVEIDNSAPEIFNTEISVNDDISRSYVVTDDTVKIVFEVHEKISDYTARIGLLKIESCTEETVSEGITKYTCSYTTPSADDGEGTKDVTIEVKDLAGNAKSYPIGQLIFDMSYPEVSSSIVIPEQVNLSSAEVQVKFSFSEDVSVLTEDITIVADPSSAEALSLSCNTGTDYKKQFTCTADFNELDTRVANYAVTVDASDRAGNKVEDVAVGTVQIDREKPTITVSDVDPVSVRSGESFDITFTVNETLAAAPIVKVGDKELPGAECSEISTNNFSCTHIANNEGDENDGTKSITVNLRDPSGNISTEILTRTISYDATRPSIINTVILPEENANQYDSNIQVRFSFSEQIDYPSSFDFKVESKEGLTPPTFSCSATGTNNQSFMCEGSYGEGNTDVDELTFSVKAADIAGNTLKEADAYEILGTLNLDRDPAEIVFGDILPDSVNKSTSEVTVEFTVNETLSENPRVYLGSILNVTPASSVVEGDLIRYTYSFTDLAELSDGYVSVLVEVADTFGNNSSSDYHNVITVDRTSPSVMTSSLSPTDINVQTETLQISLTFSEPVSSFTGAGITSSPSVFSSWMCQNPAADNQNFICTHDLSELTLADVSHEFFVEANDEAGNQLESSPVSIGTVNVDKTYPVATFNSVSPLEINKSDNTLTVSFTVSEDLDRDPIVKIGSDLFSSTFVSKVDHDYTYEFTNLDDLTDGNKNVEVVLTDTSGNEKETVYGSQISVDRTSPTVTPGGVAPAVANKNTENVTVFFSFSETVSGFSDSNVTVSPSGVLTSYSCTNPTGDNQSFKCVFDLSAVSASDGTYEFFVEATDDAGNDMESTPVKVGEFLLDTAGVEITFDSVDPATVNSATGSITVVFTTGEAPGDNPVVKIGTELSSSTPESVTNEGKTFTYMFSNLSELSDGSKNVFADVEDVSGNTVTGTWSGTIEVDKTSPSVISSSVGPDNVIALTDQISLNISFSEEMSGFSGSDITVTPSGILSAAVCTSPGGDNQTFSCTIDTSALTPAADGTYQFYASGTDTAGNTMSTPQLIGDVTVDRDIPSFTVDTFMPTEVNLGTSEVSITFTVSEILKDNPKVRLGSEKVLTAYQNKTGLTYTYVFSDLSGIPDGHKNFNISFEDVAGNYYDSDTAGPFFDRTRPYIIAGGVAPTDVNNYTQNVNVSFTFSEPVASFTASDIFVNPAGVFPAPTCSDNDGNRQSYTCTYDISSTTVTNGTYIFSVAAADDFGNSMDPTPDQVGSLEADTEDPECTFNSVLPLAVNKGTASISVSFTVSEQLSVAPVVKIGSDLLSATPATKVGLDYTYEFTDFSSLTDGNKYVTVILTDTFGNEYHSVYGSEISVDRTSPTVTPGGVAPAVANKNTENVTVFFSFSETVSGFSDSNVTVSPSGVLTSYSCTNPTGDNQSFKCVFDLSSVSASDGTYEFFVEAADDAGNDMESAPVKVGEFLLDTVGVDITFDDVTPTTVNSSTGSITVVFTAGEVPGDNPVVKIGTELSSSTPESVTNGGKTFTYTFNSLSGLSDGSKGVFVEAEDESGNNGTSSWSGTISVDRTGPSVITSSVGPEYVTSFTDQISLNISFSEPVEDFDGGSVTVSPAGILGTPLCSSPGGGNQTYICIFDTSGLTETANGSYDFYVTAQDVAGNVMDSPEMIGSTTVDRSVPFFTVDSFLPTEVNSSTTEVSITFTVSEILKDNPKVRLGSEKVLTAYQNKTGLTYTYVFSDLSGIPDGHKNFNISFEDVAGNYYDSDTAGPFFDRTSPYVVSGSVAPDKINMYTEEVNVGFTFSEPVDSFSASSISVTPGGIFPVPTCTDNDGNRQSFTCTYNISEVSVTSEISAFNVTAADDYGNTINPDPTEIGIATADIVEPECTVVSATPLVVNTETVSLDVIFTVDSDLAEDPDVFVGHDIHLDTPTSVVGHEYTYSLSDFSDVTDGEKIVRIEMKDTFGNMGTSFNSENVIFDRTRPTVVNSFASPDPVNENSVQLMLEVDFSEPVDTYDIDVTPSLDPHFNSCSLNTDGMIVNCLWTMPVPAVNIDNNYLFTVNAVDRNGNYLNESHTAGTLLDGGTLKIDRTDPVVTLNDVFITTPMGVVKDPEIAKAGDKVYAQLSFSESLSSTPNVRLGAREMSVDGEGDCLGGTCLYVLTVIAADGDGNKALNIEMEDESGNVGTGIFPDQAQVDVTAPEVTYASISPEHASVGDDINAVFYFSEDIESLDILSDIPFIKDTGQSTDSQFYYRHPVIGTSPEGQFTFSVKAVDPAGNISYGDTFYEIGTGDIDLTDPEFDTNYCDLTVSSGYTLPSGVKAGASGHIINADCKFVASEPLAAEPVLKIGGNEFTPLECGGVDDYCYLYEIQGSEGDGYKVLTVEIEDLAGNEYFTYPPADGMTAIQQVAFDFTGPLLINEYMSRTPNFAPARDNDNKVLRLSLKDPYTDESVFVSLDLAADEEIDNSSDITLSPISGPVFDFGTASATGNEVSFTKEMTDLIDEGVYDFRITWKDKLGNESTRDLEWSLSVDKSSPQAADVDEEQMIYRRFPNGNSETSIPFASLEGGLLSVPSDEIERLMVYSDSGQYLGEAQVEEDGSYNIENLYAANASMVYLNPVKYSGMKISFSSPEEIPSVLIRVPNVEWTANLNNKIAGVDWPNPNSFYNRSYFTGYFLREGDADSEEIDTFPAESFVSGQWRTLAEPDTSFSALPGFTAGRMHGAIAYDSLRGYVYVFGGEWSTYEDATLIMLNDFHRWDGFYWERQGLGGALPSARRGHTMVYDVNRDKLVLFGGEHYVIPDSEKKGDVWEWNGDGWSIKNIAGTTPSPRSFHCMAYDRKRNVSVVFGGDTSDSSLSLTDETWEYDGTSWTQKSSTGSTPDPRYYCNMTYSEERGTVLMYGGTDAAYSPMTDLWEWDGTEWVELDTAGPAYRNASIAWDPVQEVLYLVGGKNASYVKSDETWIWDGSSWTLDSATLPEVLERPLLVYHAGRQMMMVNSGLDNSNKISSETYGLVNGNWVVVDREAHPDSTVFGAASYDKTRHRIVMFGGNNGTSDINETWEFDGVSWTRQTVSTIPGAQNGHSMTFYDSRDEVILYTVDGDTYSYDGSDYTLEDGSSLPGTRLYSKMVYDSERDVVILFGGGYEGGGSWYYGEGTYQYDGTSWTKVCGSGVTGCTTEPSGRKEFAFVFDSKRNVAVLFGGIAGSGETWEWNGTLWTEKTISDPEGDGNPSDYLINPEMFFHSESGTVILVGGDPESDTFTLWQYNGSSYKLLDSSIVYRTDYTAQYFDDTGLILIHGGLNISDDPAAGTLLYNVGKNLRPAQIFSVKTDTIDMSDEARIEDVTVKFTGGANGFVNGEKMEALSYELFYAGTWIPLGDIDYGADNTGEYTFTIKDRRLIEGMRFGNRDIINIGFRSTAPSEGVWNDSRVSMQDIEMTVKYNLDGVRIEYPKYGEYYISTSLETWQDARNDCIARGGDLLIINSEDEMNYVTSLPGYTSTWYWMGFHDIGHDQEWRSVSGTYIWQGTSTGSAQNDSYTHWYPSSPSSSTTSNCVVMLPNSYDYEWYNTTCTTARRYICELDRENNYMISTDMKNWDDARTACQDLGADLVSIDGYNEQKELETLVSESNYYFLGFTDKDEDGVWRWVNGSNRWNGNSSGKSYYYTNWNPGRPYSGASYYTASFYANNDYKWQSLYYTSSQYYICEFGSPFYCSLNEDQCFSGNTCCTDICNTDDQECVSCIEENYHGCDEKADCCDSNPCNTATDQCVAGLSTGERTCEDAGDCINGTDSCYLGKCCRGHQETCTSTSQCCYSSEDCYDSTCCIPNGGSCRFDYTCCRGTCEGIISKECVCISYGDICSEDRDCCSGDCYGGHCRLGATGSFCNDSGDCTSGNCYKGYCSK